MESSGLQGLRGDINAENALLSEIFRHYIGIHVVGIYFRTVGDIWCLGVYSARKRELGHDSPPASE